MTARHGRDKDAGWDCADAFPASEIGDEHAGDAIRGVGEGEVAVVWFLGLVSREVWMCFYEQQEKFCQHCLLRSKDSYAVSMSRAVDVAVARTGSAGRMDVGSRMTPAPVFGVPPFGSIAIPDLCRSCP